MHWAIAEINPNMWKPVIKDPGNQWTNFKALPLKRIVSFGGWAYLTEAESYETIRSAILDNPTSFAISIAHFSKKRVSTASTLTGNILGPRISKPMANLLAKKAMALNSSDFFRYLERG
jgi:hypothetical protein